MMSAGHLDEYPADAVETTFHNHRLNICIDIDLTLYTYIIVFIYNDVYVNKGTTIERTHRCICSNVIRKHSSHSNHPVSTRLLIIIHDDNTWHTTLDLPTPHFERCSVLTLFKPTQPKLTCFQLSNLILFLRKL